jgi:hypothetical protein
MDDEKVVIYVLHINLHPGNTQIQSLLDGLQGILRRITHGATMTNTQHDDP